MAEIDGCDVYGHCSKTLTAQSADSLLCGLAGTELPTVGRTGDKTTNKNQTTKISQIKIVFNVYVKIIHCILHKCIVYALVYTHDIFFSSLYPSL